MGATRGILRSLLSLVREDGVSHVACAFDKVIESFRNELFEGYKRGDGVPPELMAQFPLGERAAHALGIVVWPMVEFEADDALATAAERWGRSPEVEQVLICTPDKDLAQCVRGSRVVCFDRMRRRILDEPGVVEKFGVLARVDPRLAGARRRQRRRHPRRSPLGGQVRGGAPGPLRPRGCDPRRRGAVERGHSRRRGAGPSLRDHRTEAALYVRLATLRTDVPLAERLEDLRWRGARRAELTQLCGEIGDESFLERVHLWRD